MNQFVFSLDGYRCCFCGCWENGEAVRQARWSCDHALTCREPTNEVASARLEMLLAFAGYARSAESNSLPILTMDATGLLLTAEERCDRLSAILLLSNEWLEMVSAEKAKRALDARASDHPDGLGGVLAEDAGRSGGAE